MNVKKYLKKQAEQDKQEIRDSDNGERLRALQELVTEKPKKRPALRVWLPAALSAVASIVVMITCLVVYYTKDDEAHYLDTNLIFTVSSLEELNQDLDEFEIQFNPAYSYNVKKTSDKVSGDVLYYFTQIQIPDSFIALDFVTVCNPNYEYKHFELSGKTTTAQLANYTVTYSSFIETDPQFDFETLKANAEIHKGKESVYVTQYTEILFTPEGSFLEVLQSIVK